jgi:pyruvate,water dikinase
MANIIKWFGDLPQENSGQIAGGKGASLCLLYQNGFPVPDGFVVCADGFNRFMDENGLWAPVYAKLDAIDWGDGDGGDGGGGAGGGDGGGDGGGVGGGNSLAETGEAIRALLTCAPMPGDIAASLAENYRKLGDAAPVAVRSSGTAEDLDDASFAGQQETFLYVIGEEDLIRHVKSCWASLYNDSAIFYRRQMKFSERDISIAVVVQRMANSEKAGVMFSANPINKDRGAVMIEGAWGLGEGVVQGIVNPDNYLIKKGTYEIEMEYVAEKETMVARKGAQGGVHEIDVPESLRNAPVLSAEERKELVGLAVRAETFFGKPQDIEWAVEGGRIYMLQSRPITTL